MKKVISQDEKVALFYLDLEMLNGDLIGILSKVKEEKEQSKTIVFKLNASIPFMTLIKWDMLKNIKANLGFLIYHFPDALFFLNSASLPDDEFDKLINHFQRTFGSRIQREGGDE